MRLIFAGSPDVAVPSLIALHRAGHEIVLVITQPDAKGRRGGRIAPRDRRERRGTRTRLGRLHSGARFGSRGDRTRQASGRRHRGGRRLWANPQARPSGAVRGGWVNLHFSLLPAWRGAAPVQRALMAETRSRAHRLFFSKRVSTPDARHRHPYRGDSADRHRGRPARATRGRRRAALWHREPRRDGLGPCGPVPQSDEGVSLAPKLTREDAFVTWDLPAIAVDRRIPGVYASAGRVVDAARRHDGALGTRAPTTVVGPNGSGTARPCWRRGDRRHGHLARGADNDSTRGQDIVRCRGVVARSSTFRRRSVGRGMSRQRPDARSVALECVLAVWNATMRTPTSCCRGSSAKPRSTRATPVWPPDLAYGSLRMRGLYDAIIARAAGRSVEDLEGLVRAVLWLGAHQVLRRCECPPMRR